MQRQQKYDPILPNARNWPVVQLHRQRKRFLQTVIDASIQTLLADHPTTEALQTMLSKTAAMELARIKKKTWKVDPPDEKAFWEQVTAELADQRPAVLSTILQSIVKRYAHEIVGKFQVSYYQLGQRVANYTLTRLLSPIKLQNVHRPWQFRGRLQEKIHISGAIDQLRQLAQIGTVIIVPTHFSHLDSMLIGWVTHQLGLPHFIYGAGLNLFNSKFFAYFLDNLGVYKIDRRKKNLPYLTTLKTYSRLTLQRGCHSIFYPGGTRSRSGALEQQLKLGLLGTALEAQKHNYQTQGRDARKLFVVPVVFNYHFVLEAPLLIKSHLAAQKKLPTSRMKEAYLSSYKLFQWANHFLTKDSSFSVSIGQAMDLLGNTVDEAGNSYDDSGAYVDTYHHFLQEAAGIPPEKLHEERTRTLGQAIVAAYYKISCILTSHLIAFIAFELIQQHHAKLPLEALLQLPAEKLVIPHTALAAAFVRLREVVLALHQAGQVQVENILQEGSPTAMIQHGLDNLGLYHTQRPLIKNKAGDITTQDLSTLLYYHNRLQGYDLEKHI